MAKETKSQQKTVERVMHEFKEGDLKSGGNGGRVKNRRQAIAIALSEAGASNRENSGKSVRRKAAASHAASQKSGAKTGRSSRDRSPNGRSEPGEQHTRAELYAQATRQGVAGRSRMSKDELRRAVAHH